MINLTPLQVTTANRTVATLLLLTNLYFLPHTWTVLTTGGGPMGFGLLLLPVLVSVHLLLIPAGLACSKEWNQK